MRFTLKEPLADIDFLQKNEGLRIVERISGPKVLFLGIFLGLILVIILAHLVTLHPYYVNYDFTFYTHIFMFVLIIPIHELLHLLCFPNPRKTTVGIVLIKFIVFVTTEDVFSRDRLITTTLMPLLILTIIPFLLSLFIKSDFLISIALVNLVGSGIDLISILYVVNHRKTDVFMFNGSELYYQQVK